MDDHRGLHREALLAADVVVRTVDDRDLDLPTPCAGWALRELLAHMLGQHIGFAAAVRDGDAPAEAYAPVTFSQGRWHESVVDLIDAFAGADPAAEVVEIEFSPRPLPLRVLVDAQLLDAAVHGWDVARTLGRDHTPSDDVIAVVAEVANGIADDERRLSSGFFGAAVGSGPQASRWGRVLAHLGRDPDWQPSG